VTLHLGKTPHVDDPRDLKLASYTAALPTLPPGPLGHDRTVATDAWGMLGNGPDDTVTPGFQGAGDCVWAGGDHETILWNLERGRKVTFTGACAIGDYSACTGYRIGDPSTDNGTDVRTAMGYRRSKGLRDATGRRHKITAYTALHPGDLTQIQQSLYLFGVAAIGIEFPTSAMDQFNAGKPWEVVSRSKTEGGHYVPIVYYDPTTGLYDCITWGRRQPVTARFLTKYMDEGYAPLTIEDQTRGRTVEGFDLATLQQDLTRV